MEKTDEEEESEIPVWAADSLTVMAQNGILLDFEGELTRAQAAQVLYQVSILSVTAPGMTVFRME
jgi:hypothetical protein